MNKPFMPLMLLALVSCEKVSLSDGDVAEEMSTVSIHTRAMGNTLDYPVHVYAFTSAGTLITENLLTSADDNLRLSVPQNTDCRIIAVSADPEAYSLPVNPTPSSVITMKAPTLDASASAFHRSIAQGYATRPLQIGTANLYATSSKADINLQLNYQVASLQVNISDLPAGCTNAYISVASPSASMSLGGVGEGTTTARIPLTATGSSTLSLAGGSADQSTAYLFPTSGPTTFTIAYTDAQGDHSASVNYLAPLTAGTPYILNGTYEDGHLLLTGSVTPSSWNTPVALDFSFSDDTSVTIGGTDVTPDGPADDNVYTVTAIPQPLSLWNGHLVMDVQDNVTTSSLLLLSLSEWSGLTSAFNSEEPTEAFTIANGYSEYTLTSGWRIPTEAEGRQLSQLYREHPDTFDNLLTEANADPVTLLEKDKAARYLCGNCDFTFAFNNATISKAGATVKNYHLRLVRKVEVKVSDR